MNVFIYRISQSEGKREGKKGRREKLISLLNCLKGGTNEKEALFSKILKLEPQVPRAQGIIL